MANPVMQLLAAILEQDNLQIVHKGRCFSLGDDDLPVNAGVAYVRTQISELQQQAKAAAQAE